MKFQVDILSGSKVTEGDGQTLRFLEIPAGSKNPGIFCKNPENLNPQMTKMFLVCLDNLFLFQKEIAKSGILGILGIFFLNNPGIIENPKNRKKPK